MIDTFYDHQNINSFTRAVFYIHPQDKTCGNQGGKMTGNLGTRFPQNLHSQAKYFAEVPLFVKICIDIIVNI